MMMMMVMMMIDPKITINTTSKHTNNT
jgi:hypothetical protein